MAGTPRLIELPLDTMDLQTTDAPSAKDHSRQPTTPNALGEGPAAPHQASALKSAGLEGIELRSRSPRASQDLSGKEIQLLQSHEEGDQAAETNLDEIGLGSQDEELDSDAEGSIEDDMMDKISSSPSIDDGGLFRTFFSSTAEHCISIQGILAPFRGYLDDYSLS